MTKTETPKPSTKASPFVATHYRRDNEVEAMFLAQTSDGRVLYRTRFKDGLSKEQKEYFHGDRAEFLYEFAELIVQECANQCDLLLDHNISSEWSRGTHDCSKAIKKHFGVES